MMGAIPQNEWIFTRAWQHFRFSGVNLFITTKRVELEMRRSFPLGVQFGCQKASIIQKLNASERWTQANMEMAPATGLAQGSAETFGSVSEKTDSGHA